MSDEVISRGTCVVDDVEKAAGSPLITPHAYLCLRAIVLEHEIVSGLRGWEGRDGAQDAADDLHVQVRGWNACRRMDRQIGMKSQEGLVLTHLGLHDLVSTSSWDPYLLETGFSLFRQPHEGEEELGVEHLGGDVLDVLPLPGLEPLELGAGPDE